MTRIVATGENTLTMPDSPATPPPRRADDLAASILDRFTAQALLRADIASPADARHRIGEILAMAAEWAAGRLPLAEVARLSLPAERFLAVRFGARPIPRPLVDLIDALIDATPGPDGYCYRTRHGLYTERDVAANDGGYRRDPDGRVAIVFPLTVGRATKEEDGWR